MDTLPPQSEPPTRALSPKDQGDFARRDPKEEPESLHQRPTITPSKSPPGGTAKTYPAVPGYEILGELGRGGMGVVFKARQTALKRTVALKMILTKAHAGSDFYARFHTEGEALARLRHANIVQVYEIGEHDGLPFLALEFVEGGSLARHLAGKPQQPRQAAALVQIVAQAIHHAHEHGVVHRDLKPSNILMVKSGVVGDERVSAGLNPSTTHHSPLTTHQPKITDFGIAKDLTSEAGSTATGMVLGTPGYMSPEQAAGRPQIGPPADIHALGAVLYELLTGRPPFQAATSVDTLVHVMNQEPVPPTQLQPSIPRDVETICLKCLQKDPRKRYATAAALADDLCRFCEDRPIVARPVSRRERAWRWARRNRAVAALIAVTGLATVLLIAGLLVSNVLIARQQQETQEALEKASKALDRESDALAERTRAYEELKAVRSREQRLEYFRRIGLAASELRARHVSLAGRLLDDCEPALRGWEWRFLMSHFPAESYTLRGHSDEVRALAYSPDGQFLATASMDSTVKLWGVATRKELRTLVGHKGVVASVAWSSEGSLLLSAGEDKTARIWDAATGRLIQTFRAPTGLWQAAFRPDGKRIVTAGTDPDSAVRIWDTTTGRLESALNGHAREVKGVAYSPDGTKLVSASRDGTVRLWDESTGKELLPPLRGTAAVLCVAFSPDSQQFAAGDDAQTVHVWDLTGKEVWAFKHAHWVHGIAFSPKRPSEDPTQKPLCKLLASASYDGTIQVRDLVTGGEAFYLRGHSAGVECVAFRPDGKQLASASLDHMVKVWEVAEDNSRVFNLQDHPETYYTVALSPDGRLLASPEQPSANEKPKLRSGKILVSDANSGKPIHALPGNGVYLAFGGGALLAAASGQDRTVTVWDLSAVQPGVSVEPLRNLTADADVLGVAVSADGRWLASAESDRSATLWDLATGAKVRRFRGHQYWVRSVAFSPDGRTLATASSDRTIKLWDLATGQDLATLRGHNDPVYTVAFSPDGRLLASCDHRGLVRLWDVAARTETAVLQGHTSIVFTVAFSPDSQRLVSASKDWTAKLWDVTTGVEALNISHGNEVYAAQFGPDGGRLATACKDKTVRIWDSSLAPRVLYGPEARALVGARFKVLLLREDVLESIRQDQSLHDAVRDVAVELALDRRDDSTRLNAVSWMIARDSGRDPSDYRKALRWAEVACKLAPQEPMFLNTLGVVHYRLNRYIDAIATLEMSLRLGKGRIDGFDLLFLAMSHAKLGDATNAKDHYQRALQWRERQANMALQHVEEFKMFQAEAETALRSK